MNKQKITLPTTKWGTLRTKHKPESNYVSNDEFTAGSKNFITSGNGAIEKRPTDVQYNSAALTNPGKDQFEAVFSSGVHHLLLMDGDTLKYTTGNRVVNTASSGFTPAGSMEYSMYQNRVYMDNGIDAAQVYDITPSYGGVTYSVPQVKAMGSQKPVAAPTFASDTSGGSVPLGGHTYAVTFLYYSKEESNAGPASLLRTISGPNQTVHLTAVPTGGYGVTSRNIYRDDNDGNYLLIGTIADNTTTTFTDAVSAGTTPVPVSNDLPPIFSYITLNLSRNWVAGVPGSPSVLFWSLPDFPDIFDPNNFAVCNPKDPINGVVTFQGITHVLNRHSFGKVLGSTDDTFYYEEVSGTVGCVDNRSIQIRTIDGVPVLVWLSDRGFYKFDGSSVTYISDPIEDLVNFNLQQVSFSTGSNNQSTQADYQGGTASPSIDLDSDPGVITVVNPKKIFQSRTDWESGSSLTNIATLDGSNQIKAVLKFAPALNDGTLGGSARTDGVSGLLTSTAVFMPTDFDFTGENNFSASPVPAYTGSSAPYSRWAQKVHITQTGTLTNVTMQVRNASVSTTGSITVTVWSDAFGFPGVAVYAASPTALTIGANAYATANVTVSAPLSAGDYWIGFAASSNWLEAASCSINVNAFSTGVNFKAYNVYTGLWENHSQDADIRVDFLNLSYTFSKTPVSGSGTWASPTYDSASASAVSATATVSGSYPTSCSGTLYVDASDDHTFGSGVSTFSQANPNGTYSLSLSGKRYWRIRLALATTDNRRSPRMGIPSLVFATTATWISPVIDCTTDVTSYDAIVSSANVPIGTSAAITVATSTDNVTYSGYGPVGSAVVHRYVKVKVVLTTTAGDDSTPSLSLLEFSWRQTSTFESSIVDAGQIPTGWGVFQDAAAANGGTVAFYMRSATTSGGVSGASYSAVTNGHFPPAAISPNEYAQWKIVFTSLADALPAVSGVTVNWFIGTAQSPIRATSLFYNKTYYVSVATVGSATNNLVIVWDFENNWRVFDGVTINSLGLFFNEPFYCDSVRKNIYQWLIAPTGQNSSIEMDVRTKAFDLKDVSTLKQPRSFRVTGMNTGTTIRAYYSVDRGETWTEMLNTDGTTGYVTSADSNKFSEFFVADYSSGAAMAGNTIMFRVTSVDAYPCIILELEPTVYSRSGRYLGKPL